MIQQSKIVRSALVALLVTPAGAAAQTLRVSYRPPFVPISVSVDQRGRISVDGELSIVTPLGEFSIGAELPIVGPGRASNAAPRRRRQRGVASSSRGDEGV